MFGSPPIALTRGPPFKTSRYVGSNLPYPLLCLCEQYRKAECSSAATYLSRSSLLCPGHTRKSPRSSLFSSPNLISLFNTYVPLAETYDKLTNSQAASYSSPSQMLDLYDTVILCDPRTPA